LLDITVMDSWPRYRAAVERASEALGIEEAARAEATTAQTAAAIANDALTSAAATLASARAELAASLQALEDETKAAALAQTPSGLVDASEPSISAGAPV
jgi:hypothetical protein